MLAGILRRPVWVLLVALILGGCAQGIKVTGEASAVQRMGTRTTPADYYDSVQLASTPLGMASLRYDDEKNQETLVFRNLKTGVEHNLSLENPPKSKSSFAVLSTDGSHIYAAWRPKLFADVADLGIAGDKFIYLKSSHNGGASFGPVKRLSSGGGAFVPVVASADGRNVYAAWVDERAGAQFDVYVNASQDGGNTWASAETRLDHGDHRISSIDPKVVAEGNNAWVTWVEGETPLAMYMRATTDGGLTWGPPVLVAKPTNAPVRPTLLRVKGKLLAYWYSSSGVGGAWSGNDGASWEPIPTIADTASAMDLVVTADAAGTIHMALGRKSTEEGKENIFYARSENGVQFSPATRVTSGEPFQTTATLPEIAVNADGAVLIAWQDQRYFRATINANLSRDNGRTWQKEDFSLNDKAGRVFALYPRATASGSVFSVGWTEYDTTMFSSGRTVNRFLDASGDIPKQSETIPSEQRLKQRVDAYWESRIKGDLAKTYTFMDPFFRDRNKKEAFFANQAAFTYYAARSEGHEVTGRRGKVNIVYEFELPEVMFQGKMVKVPRTEEKTVQDWLWIDDDWYLVYKNIMGRDLLVY